MVDIRVIKPQHSGSEYFNYEHYHYIVLLAICDANYRFINIDVGCYVKSSDSKIKQCSTWMNKIWQGGYNFHNQYRCVTTEYVYLHIRLLEMKALLSEHLQRPYAGINL